jgi:ERCC4-type nuclease
MKHMSMDIFLDSRESKLKDMLDVKVRQLDIGDVNILYENQVKIVIERKTLPDIAQSIKDGRYKEQKYRTMEFQKKTKCKIVYLFEDFIEFDNDNSKLFGLDLSVIKNTFINSIFRDNYHVICVRDTKESAAFISSLANTLKNNPSIYFEESIPQEDYEQCVINSKKKKHITKDNCLILQIACIPGFSSKHAKSIQSHFNVKNMRGLVDVIQEKIKETSKNPLLEIKGIGKTMSTTFFEMMGIEM